MKLKVAIGAGLVFWAGYKVGSKSIDRIWANEIAEKTGKCSACALALRHLRGTSHGHVKLPVGPSPRAVLGLLGNENN